MIILRFFAVFPHKPQYLLFSLLFLLASPSLEAQCLFNEAQIKAANTAKDASYLSSQERNIILWMNLARLYPKAFAEQCAKSYTSDFDQPNSIYRRSLLKELKKMKPAPALLPDSLLSSFAACWAEEAGRLSLTGHTRPANTSCKPDFGAENAAYGLSDAIDIVLTLLIDEGIPNVGHRRNILNAEYTRIGVATRPHKEYQTNSVMDFK